MVKLPDDFSAFLRQMHNLIDGIPHIYEGFQKITGTGVGDQEGADDLLPIVAAPAAPASIDLVGGSRVTAEPQSRGRHKATISVSRIVKEAFDKKGAMTTEEVLAYLEKTGMMAKIREVYGNKSRDTVKKNLYELRKQGLINRADGKACTPWVPTLELHVKQNHSKAVGNALSSTGESQAIGSVSDASTQSAAGPNMPEQESPIAA
jgi:hypothetical protein